MFRGYRGILAAFAGLALAGPTPPQEQAVRAQPTQQVEPTATPTSGYAPYPDYNPDPCYQAQDHDTADLCAQWRAAIAAEKGAQTNYTGNLIDGAAAILSFVSIILVVLALRQTNKSLRIAQKDRATATRRAIAQSKETAVALRAARKSANAMAKVATALKAQLIIVAETAQTNRQIADTQQRVATMQMRAYLSVTTTTAVYQDRSSNLRFMAIPNIHNSGHTPAKSVAHSIKAEILPYPLPADFRFPVAPWVGVDGYLPPQEDRQISATVDTIHPDESVPDIRERRGLALYVWGQVTYVDAFENPRETNFGQSLLWVNNPDGTFRIVAEYLPGMNTAT